MVKVNSSEGVQSVQQLPLVEAGDLQGRSVVKVHRGNVSNFSAGAGLPSFRLYTTMAAGCALVATFAVAVTSMSLKTTAGTLAVGILATCIVRIYD